MFYGRTHSYLYYPLAWLDRTTGRSYQPGYYDENGQYYESVVIKEGDKYKNVICECEYCGTKHTMDFTTQQELVCPNCGAPLKVLSNLNDYVEQQTAGVKSSGGTEKKFPVWIPVVIIAAVALLICMVMFTVRMAQNVMGNFYDSGYSSGYDGYGYDSSGYSAPAEEYLSNPEMFGRTVYLDKLDGSAYAISDDGNASYDKVLTWDSSYESYYDPEADCYLWYNTDVYPNVWQYWYEGVSSSYESGWMEYEAGTWYVEDTPGNWYALPDAEPQMWHMEEQDDTLRIEG